MILDIRQKIQPIEVLGKMTVMDYTDNSFEVYIDDKRAPKFIEEAILFYLQVKGEMYMTEVFKEMRDE